MPFERFHASPNGLVIVQREFRRFEPSDSRLREPTVDLYRLRRERDGRVMRVMTTPVGAVLDADALSVSPDLDLVHDGGRERMIAALELADRLLSHDADIGAWAMGPEAGAIKKAIREALEKPQRRRGFYVGD